jgi:hypothetical protein
MRVQASTLLHSFRQEEFLELWALSFPAMNPEKTSDENI